MFISISFNNQSDSFSIMHHYLPLETFIYTFRVVHRITFTFISFYQLYIFFVSSIHKMNHVQAFISPTISFNSLSNKHSSNRCIRMSTVPPSPTPGHTPATPRENESSYLKDWREFRARLILNHPNSLPIPSIWAHSINIPEKGSILLANPNYKWPSNFSHLEQSVILLTDINPNCAVSGLLLTRITQHTVSTHASVLARVGNNFANNPVLLGGDCSTGSLEMLHPFSSNLCDGAQEIFPGLYRGGFNCSRNLVRENQAKACDFHFFVAYSRWTWEQFMAELDKDAWHIGVCSADIILNSLKEKKHNCNLWNTLSEMLL